MPPHHLLVDDPALAALPLLAAAIGASVVSHRRSRAFRPVAWLLWGGLATDAGQRLLRLAYGGTRAPGEHYAGGARVLFHVAQAAHVAWPFGVVALAWWALAPVRGPWRAPWPALAGFLVSVRVMVATYATADPDLPSGVFFVSECVCAGAAAVLLPLWLATRHTRTPLAMAAVTVLAFEVAFLVGPYDLLGIRPNPDVLADWTLGLMARAALYACLLVIELGAWRRWRPPS